MKIAQIAPLIESVPPRLYGGTDQYLSPVVEDSLVWRQAAPTRSQWRQRLSARFDGKTVCGPVRGPARIVRYQSEKRRIVLALSRSSQGEVCGGGVTTSRRIRTGIPSRRAERGLFNPIWCRNRHRRPPLSETAISEIDHTHQRQLLDHAVQAG